MEDKESHRPPNTSTGSAHPEPANGNPQPATSKKPWPLSWILIIILGYVTAQTAFFLFFAD